MSYSIFGTYIHKNISAIYYKFKSAWGPGLLFANYGKLRGYSERGNIFSREGEF